MPWGFNFNMNNNYNNRYTQNGLFGIRNNPQNQMPGNMINNNLMYNQNNRIPINQMPQIPINNQQNYYDPNVTFEPLDETKLNELRQGILNNNSSNSDLKYKEESKTFVFNKEENDKAIEKLSQFIQNERNSSIFYEYLSSICLNENHKNTLKKLSEQSIKSSSIYNKIYKNIKGSEFKINESKINKSVNYEYGIKWAIEEENNALFELGELYDLISNSDKEKVISMAIKKISRISYLNMINKD